MQLPLRSTPPGFSGVHPFLDKGGGCRNELIRRHHRHDDDIDLIGSNAALKELFDQRSRWGWVTSGAS
ncbi:MAG: hypothetical protein WAV08_11965, partial [Desulfobacterales bacterium]